MVRRSQRLPGATATYFKDDDVGYLRWVAENPQGYVVNLRRWHDPTYVVLHRACCSAIQRYPNMAVATRIGSGTMVVE